MRKADMGSGLVQEIEDWFFDLTPVEPVDYERLLVSEEYDLTNEDDIQRLDADSADAKLVVDRLNLNYTINARHYATVEDDETIVDRVELKWEFWV